MSKEGRTPEGHEYAEAFRLMKYRDAGGNIERIWNSRDGITPFIVPNRNGQEQQHVDWQNDPYAPYHVPMVGDRIFVNLTIERARENRRKYVDLWWNVPARDGAKMSACWPNKEAAIEKLAQADLASFAPSTPDLVAVTQEMREEFEKRREEHLMLLESTKGRFA
jgi:hypothetical protein